MRILISNDDGIHAPGIKVLWSIAKELSDDIWVVAPDRNCSGASNSITMKRPVRVSHVSNQGSDHWYAVDAYPVDCILMAINHLMIDNPPDLVLSGINYGYNAGSDVSYSGTLAAAVEATRCGVKAIAFSQDIEGATPVSFKIAKATTAKIIKTILHDYGEHWPQGEFISVNFPNLGTPDLLKGVRLAKQGSHYDGTMVHSIIDHWGQECFWLGANDRIESMEPGCDLEALRQGYIAITPLRTNWTGEEKSMNNLTNIFKKINF